MKKCTNCNFVNPDSEKFCGECGTVLPETTVLTPQDPMNIYRDALINAIEDGQVPVAARRNLMEIQMQYNLDPMKVFELEKTVIEEVKNGLISAPQAVAKKRFRIKVTGHGGEYAAVKASADEIQGWINCYNKDYGDFLDAVDCSEKYSCHTIGVLVDDCEVTVTDLDTDKEIDLSEWDAPGDCENEFIELEDDEFCVASFNVQKGSFFEFEVEDYEFDVNKLQVFNIETRFGDIYVNFEYSEDPIADDCFDGTGREIFSTDQLLVIFDAEGDEIDVEEFADSDDEYSDDDSFGGETNYQIKLCCKSSDDAEKLYNGLQEEGWLDDEALSIFAPSYDCEMEFSEACHAVDDNAVVLSGFSGYCGKNNIWNLIQAFKEKSEDYSVDICSYVIKIRGQEDYIFQDFYHPAPSAVAEKLKEKLDLSDPDTADAYNEAVNYIWGFEIDEDKRGDYAEQDEENIMCGEPGIIDEILKKAAQGEFGDDSYYIQINSQGVQDEDTNLEYLQDSCKILDEQAGNADAVAEAIQCFNQANKSGAKADCDKAFALLSQVCDESVSAEALYLLGICYIREWGCKQDHQKAFDLFVQASKMGYPKANWKLGLYYEGKCNVVETDYKKARELYTAAAEAGIVEAQRLLGRLYLQLGQIEAGKKWLHSAIHGDDDKAKNILAAHYIQQVNVTDERIAVTPNINANNLRMANLEYAIPYGIYNGPDELMDNALALIGDSDPKGIESGVLLTTRGIYSQEKSLFKKTQHSAKITAGTQISMPDDTLYVDAEPFFKFKKTSTEQVQNLLAAFKQYQKFL